MVIRGLVVKIIAYVDDWNPGWVRCTFSDVYGKEWSVIEKVPVVSEEYLNETTEYPRIGTIGCVIEKKGLNKNNKEILTINTASPWGIEAEGGETIFDVYGDQIIEMKF